MTDKMSAALTKAQKFEAAAKRAGVSPDRARADANRLLKEQMRQQ